jgi:hypothetical protein
MERYDTKWADMPMHSITKAMVLEKQAARSALLDMCYPRK